MNTDTGQIKPWSQLSEEDVSSEKWVPVSDHVAALMSDAKEQQLEDVKAKYEQLLKEMRR